MAFRDIARKIKYPDGTPERYKRLDALDRLRHGTFYDHLLASFDLEYEGNSYIGLRSRRPSIIWDGAAMLTNQISGLLWGDEQMPIVRTYRGNEPSEKERDAEEGIQHIVETLNLDAVMDEATDAASSGSAAIILRGMDDKSPYVQVVPGKECIPTFDPKSPNTLLKFAHQYTTTGQELADLGYAIPDEHLTRDYWFRIEFDKTDEVWMKPMLDERFARLGKIDDATGKVIAWERDEKNSGPHGFPVINVVWAKAPLGNRIDGECLYGKIVDSLVTIDYQLSQIDRGLRYSADPMLAIEQGELKDNAVKVSQPATKRGQQTQKDSAGRIIKSPQNILWLDPGGSAKVLEITAAGLVAAGDFVKMIREYGLEIAGGMKSDASTTKGVESGRALEMLFQALVLVVKRWRVALGNNAFLPLLRLILIGIAEDVIAIDGLAEIDPNVTMRLAWPTWMTPTGADLMQTVNAWQTLAGGSSMHPVPILPRDIVSRMAASNLGFTDVIAILEQIDQQTEQDKADAQADAQAQADLTIKTAAATAASATNGAKPGSTK